jgi:tRNA(adenine34) deaminase
LNKDHFFMGLAIAEAQKAYALAEVPVGAVLVNSAGEVIAKAHNLPISSCDPTAHAEILAVRAASVMAGNYRLPETFLYVTLEPCAMCLGALLHARVRRLIFGTRDPRSGAAGSVLDLTAIASFNHHIEVVEGIRAAECSAILRQFFKARRG